MDLKATIGATNRVAFLVQRIGPYHHARLRALAENSQFSVCSIEFRPSESAYTCDPVEEGGGYSRIRASIGDDLGHVLDDVRPDVVVCVGYADPEIHRAAAWALSRCVPLVTCSDSTYADWPRTRAKEALKRLVILAFDAALVAGTKSRSYLGTLGLDFDYQFAPWDVVDNEHFERGAEAVKREPGSYRARLRLPERFFICVARFIPEKNLRRLVEAYARYAARAGESAWSLVLAGDGPLEADIRAQVASERLGQRVCFPGFLGYADLPTFYGLAGALILSSESETWGLVVNEAMAAGLPIIVSSRCGCAPDLVCEEENGLTFDAGDTAAMSESMRRIAESKPERLAAMGKRSREIVAAYTPERFAVGLKAAIECAHARGPRWRRQVARVALAVLASRTVL